MDSNYLTLHFELHGVNVARLACYISQHFLQHIYIDKCMKKIIILIFFTNYYSISKYKKVHMLIN